MSKTLKKNECFLRFILDPLGSKKQVRFVLLNTSSIQLQVLTEILHNILKNQAKFKLGIQKIIKKHKRLMKKFITSYKKKTPNTQRRILIRNIRKILDILVILKDIILGFFKKIE